MGQRLVYLSGCACVWEQRYVCLHECTCVWKHENVSLCACRELAPLYIEKPVSVNRNLCVCVGGHVCGS